MSCGGDSEKEADQASIGQRRFSAKPLTSGVIIGFSEFLERLPSPVKPRFDCTRANSHPLGGLFGVEAVDVAEHNHPPMVVGLKDYSLESPRVSSYVMSERGNSISQRG